MFNYTLFFVILTIFIFFVLFQVYFYSKIDKKNSDKLKKIESFQSTLKTIDKNGKDYILDDNSMERLLSDYKELF